MNKQDRYDCMPDPSATSLDWETLRMLVDVSRMIERLALQLRDDDLGLVALNPILAVKALNALRLDGHAVEWADLYMVESPAARTAANLYHLLQAMVREIEYQPTDLLNRYARLTAGVLPVEQVGLRKNQSVDPQVGFLLPPAEALPVQLAELAGSLKASPLPLPIRMAKLYAEVLRVQPFPTANTAFGLLLVDQLAADWLGIRPPVLDLAGVFLEKQRAYQQHLHAYLIEDDQTGWLKFFFAALDRAVSAATGTLGYLPHFRRELAEDVFQAVNDSPVPLVRFLLSRPVFHKDDLRVRFGLDSATAEGYLRALQAGSLITPLNQSADHYQCLRTLGYWDRKMGGVA